MELAEGVGAHVGDALANHDVGHDVSCRAHPRLVVSVGDAARALNGERDKVAVVADQAPRDGVGLALPVGHRALRDHLVEGAAEHLWL